MVLITSNLVEGLCAHKKIYVQEKAKIFLEVYHV